MFPEENSAVGIKTSIVCCWIYDSSLMEVLPIKILFMCYRPCYTEISYNIGYNSENEKPLKYQKLSTDRKYITILQKILYNHWDNT